MCPPVGHHVDLQLPGNPVPASLCSFAFQARVRRQVFLVGCEENLFSTPCWTFGLNLLATMLEELVSSMVDITLAPYAPTVWDLEPLRAHYAGFWRDRVLTSESIHVQVFGVQSSNCSCHMPRHPCSPQQSEVSEERKYRVCRVYIRNRRNGLLCRYLVSGHLDP